MAATALLLPSLAAAAPTPTQQLRLRRGSLDCCSRSVRPPRRRLAVSAVQETKDGEAKTAEEITEKYGLEFGLWKVSGGQYRRRRHSPTPFIRFHPHQPHVS